MAAAIVTCPNCGKRNRLRPAEDGVPRCGNCDHLLPWLVDSSTADFEAELRAPVPVLVDFWPLVRPVQVGLAGRRRPGQAQAGKLAREPPHGGGSEEGVTSPPGG